MPDNVQEILTRIATDGKYDARRAAGLSIDDVRRVVFAEPIYRNLDLNREETVDVGARTVALAFVSDQPIEHWVGYIKLSMKKGHVRTARSANGLPLCMGHNLDAHVGKVNNITYSAGVGRGIGKLSRNPGGVAALNDIEDDILSEVSVGFMIYALDVESEKDGMITYICRDWEPYEISLVPAAKDISVGVGRAHSPSQFQTPTPPVARALSNNTEITMPDPNIETPVTPPVVETPQRSAQAEAVANVREIVEFAEIFGEGDLARTMVASSTAVTLDDVRTAIKAKQVAPATPAAQTPAAQARAEGGVVELARNLPRFGTLRNFKGDNAAERAYRFGQWFLAARGLAANKLEAGPFARAAKFCETHGIEFRAMSEGVNESGGNLVPDEFGNDLIDLREVYGVFRRNAKMVPMSSDSRSDPRRDGGLTAYFEGEGDAITASDMSWGRVTLAAEKLAVLARYSSEVNEDALINFGDTLAGEIAYAFALKEDQCGFIGDGSSTYGGMQGVTTKIKALSGTIANIAGLVVATGTGYASSYGSTVLSDFEAVVGKLPVYADTSRARWFMSKSYYWNVAKRLELASGGVTAAEVASGGGPRFLGYDVEIVQVMPKNPAVSQVCALLGDLSLAASFGSRRDTTIAISEHSRFANDQIEIRGTERFDINVHDVGNASGTAALRVEGPIVGLITAAS